MILLKEDVLRFLDIKVINTEDFLDLLLRFGINMLVVFAIVHFIYRGKKSGFTFTYYTLSVLVFLLCFLLGNVKLELGFTLGLFAIFSIIRYRTSLISIREMTYLFVVIGVAVFNALSNKKVSWVELAFANLAILSVMYIRELVIRPKYMEKFIKYDNVNLIHADRKSELKSDLEDRLGVDVLDVEVGNVDYIKDMVELTVFYKEKKI